MGGTSKDKRVIASKARLKGAKNQYKSPIQAGRSPLSSAQASSGPPGFAGASTNKRPSSFGAAAPRTIRKMGSTGSLSMPKFRVMKKPPPSKPGRSVADIEKETSEINARTKAVKERIGVAEKLSAEKQGAKRRAIGGRGGRSRRGLSTRSE